jgi:hypothetical protein
LILFSVKLRKQGFHLTVKGKEARIVNKKLRLSLPVTETGFVTVSQTPGVFLGFEGDEPVIKDYNHLSTTSATPSSTATREAAAVAKAATGEASRRTATGEAPQATPTAASE